MLEFDQLKQIIADAEEDVSKAESGNKAAGTRVRKAMQDIKNTAQDIRKKVLEFREDGDSGSSGGGSPKPPFGGGM